MPTFNLNTTFTEQDLERMYISGSNIVVAKPNDGGAPNVAWVVYNPLIENSMSWEENYGIYASNKDLISGGLLTQMSKTAYPAVGDMLYDLSPTGAFVGPNAGGAKGSYSAVNDYDNAKGYLTFGLYQNAQVNEDEIVGNAVSAATVLYKSTATMTPFTTVYLWIQSQVRSNSVLTTVTSPQTKVIFGGSTTSVSLKYNPRSGTFIPATSALAEGLALEYVAPAI